MSPDSQQARILTDVYWTMHLRDNWRIKHRLDATCYFIVLLIGSTCIGHYYAHHRQLVTTMPITTSVVSFLVCRMSEVRCGNCGLTAPNLRHTANQERNDQCRDRHRSRKLPMMGIIMPETCWAYKKYKNNKWHLVGVLFFSLEWWNLHRQLTPHKMVGLKSDMSCQIK